jgi:hypothetical protein
MSTLPKLVVGKSAIRELWERYERELTASKRSKVFVGSYTTPGANIPSHDAFSFRPCGYNIYWKTGDRDKTKIWNTFGEGEPSELRDAFQVNIPHDGLNRRIRGGFLARGKEVFLLHRGPLGGRRTPNLKDLVPDFVDVFEDDDRESDGVLFPFLDATGSFHKDFLPTVARAVKIVAEQLGRR